jgi:hypothetical protein
MNELVYRKKNVMPPGGGVAYPPAPSLTPRTVTLYGRQEADPLVVFSQSGTYSGTYYAQGTYMGTNPPMTVFAGTSITPGQYQGTYYATFWGFPVPYGWTGTIYPGTLLERTGTLGSATLQKYGGDGATVDNVHVMVIGTI